ncbi:MAG: hypothetical protein HPY67_05505 [Syntrophaceae bacterium]|nr:hypothetical protein [Syntrophaceae bacterium]
MFSFRRLLAAAMTTALILGCGSGSPAPKARDAAPGRAETKAVEAASAVGYSGSQMRKKIDKTLDQAEERARQVEKGAESAAAK